jgi:sugar O-acyltransferase (sialic acid O-acetyltransferase NeuD family)
LLVFGAGGHGRVVADAALVAGHWSCVAASDRDPARCHGELLSKVALMDFHEAQSMRMDIHIAVGSNAAREREATVWGHDRLVSVVHPAAVVSPFSSMAAGCFVAAGAILAPGSKIGACVIVNHGAVVDHDVQIGSFTHIAPHATLGGSVIIGERVLVGQGTMVLPGLHIANDVVLGAGSVVTAHITHAGTYVGAPARRIS